MCEATSSSKPGRAYTFDDVRVGTTLVATPSPNGTYNPGRLTHVATNVGRDNVTYDSFDNGVRYATGIKLPVTTWVGFMNGDSTSDARVFTVEQPGEVSTHQNRKRVEASDLKVGQVWHRDHAEYTITRHEAGVVQYDVRWANGHFDHDNICEERYFLSTLAGAIDARLVPNPFAANEHALDVGPQSGGVA